MVLALQAKLKAKSKVEVVRRGLRLLREVTERDALREAYRQASRATRASLSHEIDGLDHLAAGFSTSPISAPAREPGQGASGHGARLIDRNTVC